MHSRSFQFQSQPRSKPTSRPAFLTISPASGQMLSTSSYSLSLPPLPIGGRNSVVHSVSVSTRSMTFLPRGESYLEASTAPSVGNSLSWSRRDTTFEADRRRPHAHLCTPLFWCSSMHTHTRHITLAASFNSPLSSQTEPPFLNAFRAIPRACF